MKNKFCYCLHFLDEHRRGQMPPRRWNCSGYIPSKKRPGKWKFCDCRRFTENRVLNKVMEQWFGEKVFPPLSPEKSEELWNRIKAKLG